VVEIDPSLTSLRAARPEDSLCLGVLATQVFLGTYATTGIRPTLAREVLGAFSTAAFAAWLERADTLIHVAEHEGHLIGFAHVTLGAPQEQAPPGVQAELLRLYVQEPFTGQRVGRALLLLAEQTAAQAGATVLWLSPWVHNQRALAFYASQGYADHGSTWFTMEDEAHENRVLARSLPRTGEPRSHR